MSYGFFKTKIETKFVNNTLSKTTLLFDFAAPLRKTAGSLLDKLIPRENNNFHPHALRPKALGFVAIFLTVVKLSIIGVELIIPAGAAFSAEITVATIYTLTNDSRKESKLPELAYNIKLEKAAQAKADDMLAKGYFAHETPDGKSPWDFIIAQKYSYLSAGENLAVDFVQAEDVNDAWMHSPGHRANILSKHFEEIGIGIATGVFQGHRATFVVQMFGSPSVEPVMPLTKPTVPTAQATGSVKGAESQSEGVVEFVNVSVQPKGRDISVSAQTSAPVSRVVVAQGDQAFELMPSENNQWEGKGELLRDQTSSIIIKAYRGNTLVSQEIVASVDASFVESSQSPKKAFALSLFGKQFVLSHMEQTLYLSFAIALLVLLLLAIAIKRHILHVSLVANTAAVCAFAVLLWYVA